MSVNIGTDERVIRLFAGMIIASMCIFYNSAWALIGIPIMVSAAVGICPLYKLLGIKTVSRQSSEA